MGAVAHEMGHLVVVELGRSLFRPVTLAAVPAQLAAMRVILFVAVHAGDVAQFVAPVDVAPFALCGLMQAFQRESLAVFPDEAQVFEMLGGRVTLGAVVAELPVVFVFFFVTVDTGQLVGAVDLVLVTVGALAAHLGLVVEADEREARIFVVGEGPRARAALHVATSARLVRELALVHAPVLVTGHAAALAVRELRALAVAFLTVQRLMLAQKGKAEATVVDFGLFPGTPGEVARRALGGVGGHGVEGTVAVGALARRGAARHLGLGVALGARLFQVLAVKGSS